MRESINGLVLSYTSLKESDKFITLLTAEYGKISVYCNHVRNIKKGALTGTMPMQYCRFYLDKKHNGYTMLSADVICSFFDISKDLSAFSLAQYVLDIAKEIAVENNTEAELLSLTLNTLYAIQQGKKPKALIKASFELRVMAQSGYMPDLSGCDHCGGTSGDMYFDIMNGRLICAECMQNMNTDFVTADDLREAVIILRINPTVCRAMRYVLSADKNRLFSYSIPEEDVEELGNACEKFILNHLERGFDTLAFYKEVVSM